MMQEFSFGIVPLQQVEEGLRVLLIFHQKGRHWSFPKGHKDPGETDLETAIRELKEETGLVIDKIIPNISYREKYTFYKFHEQVCKTVCYYPALVKGVLELQAEEILDAKWLPIEEAIEHLTFSESKEICRKISFLDLKSL